MVPHDWAAQALRTVQPDLMLSPCTHGLPLVGFCKCIPAANKLLHAQQRQQPMTSYGMLVKLSEPSNYRMYSEVYLSTRIHSAMMRRGQDHGGRQMQLASTA